jgi:hypothetical protein
MIKYLFILGLIFTLSSCSDLNVGSSNQFVVETIFSSEQPGMVYYQVQAQGIIQMRVLCRKGEFEVGDTLTLSKLK